MKTLRWTLFISGLVFGSILVVLAGTKVISLATLALFVILPCVAVSVALVSSGGRRRETAVPMLCGR